MDALQNLMRSLPEGMDCAVILSETNRRYFTGFPASDGVLFVTRRAAWLLIDSRYIEAARAQAKGCEVALLTKRDAQLAELARTQGCKTAGIESFTLSLHDFNALRRGLPELMFEDSDRLSKIIEEQRTVKAPEELDAIRRAQRITDDVFSHILGQMKPGACERDLALEIEYFMKKAGAQGPSFDLIVISGEKTSMPHGVPGERRLREGDFVTLDIGARVDGYCSDMTRTVALGKVSDEQKKVYETVLKANLLAEELLHAGAVCSEVDAAARRLIDDAGYKGCFGHGLGHSVGLEIHESPRLSPSCDSVLKENMLMTVEPGIYLPGRFGVRIEDLVVLREGGIENLTKSPKELIIL